MSLQRLQITKLLIECSNNGLLDTKRISHTLFFELKIDSGPEEMLEELFNILPIEILVHGLKKGFESETFHSRIHSFIYDRRAKLAVILRKINKEKSKQSTTFKNLCGETIMPSVGNETPSSSAKPGETKSNTTLTGRKKTNPNKAPRRTFLLRKEPIDQTDFFCHRIETSALNLSIVDIKYSESSKTLNFILKSFPNPSVLKLKINESTKNELSNVIKSGDLIINSLAVNKAKNIVTLNKIGAHNSDDFKYSLTFKSWSNTEHESTVHVALEDSEAESLLKHNVFGEMITKDRLISKKQKGWYLDILLSPLKLIKLECVSDNYVVPPAFGDWKDVTFDGQYSDEVISLRQA